MWVYAFLCLMLFMLVIPTYFQEMEHLILKVCGTMYSSQNMTID